MTLEGAKVGAEFYRSFIKAKVNVMSSLKAAESTKIVENTFRDINIAYVNELAMSFDKLGIDVLEVINGASNKPFAFMPHYPSCGVGGHCIPVDPYYLIDYAEKNGFSHNFLKQARKVNNSMPRYAVDKLIKRLSSLGLAKKAKIGVLGLSYKANIPDMRESPALRIIEILESKGYTVLTYDPHCIEHSNSTLKEIIGKCAGVIVTVNHAEFKKIKRWGRVRVIVDGKNFLNPQEIVKKGIIYTGIGREFKSPVNVRKINKYKALNLERPERSSTKGYFVRLVNRLASFIF